MIHIERSLLCLSGQKQLDSCGKAMWKLRIIGQTGSEGGHDSLPTIWGNRVPMISNSKSEKLKKSGSCFG